MEANSSENSSNIAAETTTLSHYFNAIGIPMCLLFSLINFIVVVLAYMQIRKIVFRQLSLNQTIDYLTLTVSKQIFPLKSIEDKLQKTGYSIEKLEKSGWDFKKWYEDRGASFRKPDDLFGSAAADDQNYATLRIGHAFWKLEKSSTSPPTKERAESKTAYEKREGTTKSAVPMPGGTTSKTNQPNQQSAKKSLHKGESSGASSGKNRTSAKTNLTQEDSPSDKSDEDLYERVGDIPDHDEPIDPDPDTLSHHSPKSGRGSKTKNDDGSPTPVNPISHYVHPVANDASRRNKSEVKTMGLKTMNEN